MKAQLEYSNATAGGRLVETPEGKKQVTDIRSLGCPDELASSIEKRNAERNGVVPASDLKAQLETFKQTILSV
jgi:hypothetical protein